MGRFLSRSGLGRRAGVLAIATAVLAACGPTAWSTGELLSPTHPELKRVCAHDAVNCTQPPEAPEDDVDRNLSHYVLMGLEDGEFKGDNGVTEGIIRGGHVGVNAPGFGEGGVRRLRMCGADRATSMDKGSQVVASTARLGRMCNLWDVYTEIGHVDDEPMVHTYTLMSEGTLTPIFKDNNGDATQDANELPPLPAEEAKCKSAQRVAQPIAPGFYTAANPLPVKPGIASQWYDVTFKGENSKDPNPDKWSHYWLADNTTYRFCDLKLDGSAWVHMGVNTEVFVDGEFSMGNGNVWGDLATKSARMTVRGAVVEFAKNSTFNGVVWAPNAQLRLGNSNILNGNFWGKSFISDSNLRINPDGGGGGPTTLPPTNPPTSGTTNPTTTNPPPTTAPPTTNPPPTTAPPTTGPPPTTAPPTTNPPPTTAPPTTQPPTTQPPTTRPPTTPPPTTSPPTLPPE